MLEIENIIYIVVIILFIKVLIDRINRKEDDIYSKKIKK